jgi:hypothetical protein
MLVFKQNDTRSVSEISKRSLLSIENELGQLEKNQDEDLEYSFEETPTEGGNDGFTNGCESAKTSRKLPLSSYNRTSGFSDNLSSIPIEKISSFGSVKSNHKSNLEDSLNSNLGLVSPSRLRAKIRKASRSSTREAIRKTITEIERQLINRRSYMISSKISNESIFNQSISHIDKVDDADLSPIHNKEFTNFDSFSNVMELPEPETTLEQLHSPRFDMNPTEDKSESDSLAMANVDSFSIICNTGMGSGRSLEEEYFLMLTIASKMNSKHLNDICYVSGEKLYEIAKSYNIPFFKVTFI